MLSECCDKDGQPSTGILVAVLGMGNADAGLGRAGTVVALNHLIGTRPS